MSAESITATMSADEIMESLPQSEYASDYQPTYDDQDALRAAINELQNTTPATTPDQIDSLRTQFYEIATDQSKKPVIVAGRCAEPVDINMAEGKMADNLRIERTVIQESITDALIVARAKGQNTKPRSSATEEQEGVVYASYMGDAVNGLDLDKRTPDPSRMVAAAVQARDLSALMSARLGNDTYAAHEALLIPYELAFKRQAANGKEYLLTADLPWIGARTNDPNGYHANMLATIENPVGVKIGPDSTPEHIEGLRSRLNPDGIPGKLVFMLRAGHDKLDGIAQAIADIAPESLTMYDIHGVTRTVEDQDGKKHKIRAVPEIIDDIQRTTEALGKAGLILHGLHLETIADNSRLECVDRSDQLPTHPGGVDPQLNPRQLKAVLLGTKHLLMR